MFDQEREKIKDEDKARIEELEKQIAELAGNEPAKLPVAMTVADLATAPQAIHLAANPSRKVVQAGGFSILDSSPFALSPTPSSTGQRTALANWITSPENPLAARVIVNRVWQHHLGVGLVDTASDFGSLGGRPSHPELLDWLATELIAHNWSIKWLHRQILNSATWQMSSFHPEASAAEQVDPENKLRWRFKVRRLNAEQIRDAMLTISGELLSEHGGPSAEHVSLRRSLYLKVLRNTPEPLMTSLDGVDGINSIPKRSTTTTPTQALNLMNGEWVRKRSTSMARRVLEEAVIIGDADGAQMNTIADVAFRIALGRVADVEEVSIAAKLMDDSIQSNNDSIRTDDFGSLAESTGTSLRIGDTSPSPVATFDAAPQIAAPFTVVSMFRLDSLYPDATVRTLVSQWDSNNANRGWAIVVTSEKSAFKPRNFIMQVVTDGGYEVVASNLRPELNQVYLAAVSVEQLDSGKAVAKFYLKPLNVQYGKLEVAEVEFKTAAGIDSKFALTIGGRVKQDRHRWDGQLDQVAIFDKVLSVSMVEELFAKELTSESVTIASPAMFWNFDDVERPLVCAKSHQHNLRPTEERAVDPLEQAVAELCQVLLNCNEFVYID